MLPCYWHEDEHGERILIPGCMARVQDPDEVDCTCQSLAPQLEQAHEHARRLQAQLASLRDWHTQVLAAVNAHPDGAAIMRAAANHTHDPERNTRP